MGMDEPLDVSVAGVVATLNGKPVALRRQSLTYRDILGLAGHGPLSSASPVVRVRYPATSERVIGPGESADVRAGMVIEVGLGR